MSSPPDSLTDIEESLNKKRGRAQSVEPTLAQDIDDELNPSQEASTTLVSAPKKTKRDDEDNNTAVSTIRKTLNDMTTADKTLTERQKPGSESQDNDELMSTIAEEEEKTVNSLAKFGGSNEDDDDWGEFAEEEEEVKLATTKDTTEEKPKYTFGASSGFGTKGWVASNQTIPTPSKQPTFGGFDSNSGFGGFKSANTNNDTTLKTATISAPFGSFGKTTTSPFAAAAAAGNALSSPNEVTTSPTISATSTDVDNKETDDSEDESSNNNHNDTPTFGEGARVKVPGVKQTEVKTGEEDEDIIFQTKAKLLVLDTSSGNWKERGVGTFRINIKEEENKNILQTRLVMRTDSVYRVILNLLLFEGMKVFIMQDKFVRFAGFETETKEDGTSETKLVSYALKLSNPTIASELCDQIVSCIPTSNA